MRGKAFNRKDRKERPRRTQRKSSLARWLVNPYGLPLRSLRIFFAIFAVKGFRRRAGYGMGEVKDQ
jgi:hypothetical protein